MTKKRNIALFGFGKIGQAFYQSISKPDKSSVSKITAFVNLGTIGQDYYQALQKNNDTNFEIKKIAVRNRFKERIIASQLITLDKWEILNDASIDVIVELTSKPKDALYIIKEALKRGKRVITVNQKLMVMYADELIALQTNYKTQLFYDASFSNTKNVVDVVNDFLNDDEFHITAIDKTLVL